MINCKDCKLYDAYCHDYAFQFINSKNIKVIYTTGCTMGNANGNCNAFIRKWWKFWVKNKCV